MHGQQNVKHVTDFDVYVMKLLVVTVNSVLNGSYLVGVSNQDDNMKWSH